MALTPCMTCLKSCGYLCGLLAGLNIWFWIGMTIFNAMGNPWIAKEILMQKEFTSDTSQFTTVFGLCIFVSAIFFLSYMILFQLNLLCLVGCCWCTKCPCYQDKDQIVYYAGQSKVGVSNLSSSSNQGGFKVQSSVTPKKQRLNGSSDSEEMA